MRFFKSPFSAKLFFVAVTFFLPFISSAQDSILSDSVKYHIVNVVYSGNKQTKNFIIERELAFKLNDTLSGSKIKIAAKHSEDNLQNTSLFNFVTVLATPVGETSSNGITPIIISVSVKERWYTWPTPIFDVAEQNVNVWWRNGHNFQRASYGFFLWRYNFRGRKESIALICRFGYSQQFGGQYAIPSFNKKRTFGVTLTGTYTRNHEVSFATRNNKLVFYKDNINRIRGETSGSILFSYRKGVYWKQTFDLRFTNLTIYDTVVDLNPDYFVNGRSQMEYFTISYHLVHDSRDIKAYTLRGNFEDFEITKHGLGILADEKLNLIAMAASLRMYQEIYPRVFLAEMIRGRWNPSRNIPYYHQRALGFGTYIRGYEYYVIDGESYGVAKFSVRYQLLKPHIYKFPFLPVEKFNTFHLAVYGGLYADAGYVQDRESTLSDHNELGNSLLFGYGAGIDVVTYYDVAIRFEYSFNIKGENGFFLHFGASL